MPYWLPFYRERSELVPDTTDIRGCLDPPVDKTEHMHNRPSVKLNLAWGWIH